MKMAYTVCNVCHGLLEVDDANTSVGRHMYHYKCGLFMLYGKTEPEDGDHLRVSSETDQIPESPNCLPPANLPDKSSVRAPGTVKTELRDGGKDEKKVERDREKKGKKPVTQKDEVQRTRGKFGQINNASPLRTEDQHKTRYGREVKKPVRYGFDE